MVNNISEESETKYGQGQCYVPKCIQHIRWRYIKVSSISWHIPDLSITKTNSWLLLYSDSFNWGKKFSIRTSWERIPSENKTQNTTLKHSIWTVQYDDKYMQFCINTHIINTSSKLLLVQSWANNGVQNVYSGPQCHAVMRVTTCDSTLTTLVNNNYFSCFS